MEEIYLFIDIGAEYSPRRRRRRLKYEKFIAIKLNHVAVPAEIFLQQ